MSSDELFEQVAELDPVRGHELPDPESEAAQRLLALSMNGSAGEQRRVSALTRRPALLGAGVPRVTSVAMRARERRLALVLAALVVAGAAAIISGVTLSGHGAGTRRSGGDLIEPPRSAVVGGLSFNYPRAYDRHHFSSCRRAVTFEVNACVEGVVVANYRLNRNPDLRDSSDAGSLSKGVAFELYYYRSARQPRSGKRRLPLSLSDLRLARLMSYGSEREALLRINDAEYRAVAWIGRQSDKHDRAALAAFVTSVHEGSG